MGPIGQLLLAQAERQWAQIAACLDQLDDTTACRGEGVMVPKRLLAHIIETVDFYVSPAPDSYKWGDRLPDWEGAEISAFPDLAGFREYLAEVGQRMRAWFAAHDDAALLDGNTFPWTGANHAERMVYVMRHTGQHLGEINALLRAWDVPRVAWK